MNLRANEQYLILRMELDFPGAGLPTDLMIQEVESLHGSLDIEEDEDTNTKYISLSFPAGGARK